MEILFVVFKVIQAMGVSLGVGCSTVAILFYLTRDPNEPNKEAYGKFVSFVYKLLRIAMYIILLSTVVIAAVFFPNLGWLYFTTYEIAIWTYIAVLFVNAILMTAHLMPRSIGPSLQGATWYALGITSALPAVIVIKMSYLQFLVWYLAFVGVIILAITLYLHHKKD